MGFKDFCVLNSHKHFFESNMNNDDKIKLTLNTYKIEDDI